MTYDIQTYAFTNKGQRSENQDAYLELTSKNNIGIKNKDMGDVFIVADGMGGEQAGKEAAVMLCDRLYDEYMNYKPEPDFENPDQVTSCLESIALNLNDRLKDIGESDPTKHGWGSTASILVVRPPMYYFVHAGDTRIYLFRNHTAELLTEDHNIAYQNYILTHKNYEKYLTSKGHNKLLSFFGNG